MNLEDIMLKEVSQPQEDEFYMNPLKKVITVKFIETKSTMRVARPAGRGNKELLFKGIEFELWKIKFWRFVAMS